MLTFFLLNFKSSLYTLDHCPSSEMCFAKIISQSVACPFILLTMSFVEQMFLILMKYIISVFSFMDHAFSFVPKKASINPWSLGFISSSKSITLILICRMFSCSSVIQSCPTVCDSMDCSMPGFLPFTISQSLLKLMPIESVMPSNYLILCRAFLLLPSIFPSIRVISN